MLYRHRRPTVVCLLPAELEAHPVYLPALHRGVHYVALVAEQPAYPVGEPFQVRVVVTRLVRAAFPLPVAQV